MHNMNSHQLLNSIADSGWAGLSMFQVYPMSSDAAADKWIHHICMKVRTPNIFLP